MRLSDHDTMLLAAQNFEVAVKLSLRSSQYRMKTSFTSSSRSLLSLWAALLLVGCGGGGGTDAPTGPAQPAAVSTVTVSGQASLEVGATAQMIATVRDASGNTLSGRVVSWSSSSPPVATVSDAGLVTALTPGSVTITATAEGKSGTSSVSVSNVPVATVTLTPPSGYLYVGEAAAFVVTLKDSQGNVLTGRPISWASSTQSVASVASNGLLSALAAGTSTVTATSEGKTGSALLTVLTRPPEPAPVATITLSPAAGSLSVGQSGVFGVTVKDAAGNILTGRTLAWSSSNSGIASVAANGLVSGLSVGTATITATAEGKSGSATATVSNPATAPAAVATVTLSPASASLYLGDYGYFGITLRDGVGNVLSNRVVTWSTNNPSVASVASDGLVTGIGIGSATITATSEGKTGSATLVVTNRPSTSTNLCTLIGGGRIVAADAQFLGSLTNKYNGESVLNQYGNYGSAYSSTSIYNKYGDYGSPYSSKSAYNPYTSSPPRILFSDGTFLWLTVNTSFASNSSVHPDFLKTCTNFP